MSTCRCLLAVLALLACANPARPAERIVSLNLCTDQMLVLLAPEKIVALSLLARDPALSFVAAQAQDFPVIRASAEAVLRLKPGLVLAARFGARTTLALLERQGIPILRVDLPTGFGAIRAWTRDLARILGHPERGEALIAAMDATLTLSGLPSGPPPRTVIAVQPRGYTAGPDSTMGAVLAAAGLTNVSPRNRIGPEALLRNPPDLLVVPVAPAFPSLATAMLRNGPIARLPQRAVPPALTICAGPFTANAVAILAP